MGPDMATNTRGQENHDGPVAAPHSRRGTYETFSLDDEDRRTGQEARRSREADHGYGYMTWFGQQATLGSTAYGMNFRMATQPHGGSICLKINS